MTHKPRESTRRDDELSPEELGKVSGGSIPVRPPKPPTGPRPGRQGPLDDAHGSKPAPPKQQADDFIKPF